MLYRVTIYRPNMYEPSYDATESFIACNLKQAEQAVSEKLGRTFESSYSYRRNRRPSAQLHSRKQGQPWVRMHPDYEQEVIIVPSVGELGYTP